MTRAILAAHYRTIGLYVYTFFFLRLSSDRNVPFRKQTHFSVTLTVRVSNLIPTQALMTNDLCVRDNHKLFELSAFSFVTNNLMRIRSTPVENNDS